MIGYLTGVPSVTGSNLVVMVGGVGYHVLGSPSLLTQLEGQSQTSLFIYTHVKENALELYGFSTQQDKQLFQLLLDVSGVGPATALAIGDHGSTAIIQAVQTADVKFFTQIPRVGKKLAQKIIIDLKSKLGSLRELELGAATPASQEVVAALLALGFDEQAAYRAVKEIKTNQLSTSEAIKAAIKVLSP